MTEYVNPETIARYEAGFNKYAKNGALPVLQIVPALEEAKEDYTQDDVFDALEIMGIKDEPLKIDQFMDLIGIMKDPETIARYEAGFNKYAKNGALPVLQIVPALEEAKEDYTQDDVFDALEIMGIKDEPLKIDQFMDLIGIMKDPETIIDAFSIFDTDKRGVIDEDELRSMLRKYAPDLKGKEIEEILEKPNVTTNGKVNYKAFVQYWMDQ